MLKHQKLLKSFLQDALDGQKTGGLTWHWQAWRSQHRWQHTRLLLEQFLLQAPTKNIDKLILIGGSAGWMMSSQWLSQFEKIVLIDIDPLAPIFFKHNHRQVFRDQRVSFQFERRDGIMELPQILKQYPQGLIWFDNVLGQQCYRFKNEVWVERQLNHLKTLLNARTWGSVHDLLSGPILGNNPFEHPQKTSWIDNPIQWTQLDCITTGTPEAGLDMQTQGDMDDFDLPGLIDLNHDKLNFQQASERLLAAVQACGIWQDHLSAQVFPLKTPTQLIAWPFRQGYCHWLQAGFCNL